MNAETKVNSLEGISHLIAWARGNKVYLSQAHIDTAKRFGVSTEGVLVTDTSPNPLHS